MSHLQIKILKFRQKMSRFIIFIIIKSEIKNKHVTKCSIDTDVNDKRWDKGLSGFLYNGFFISKVLLSRHLSEPIKETILICTHFLILYQVFFGKSVFFFSHLVSTMKRTVFQDVFSMSQCADCKPGWHHPELLSI